MTGIPHRQDDHAVIMAEFACQIVQEFDTVVAGLMEELGPDTATLQLRAGCHSGPVTAGVLRGETKVQSDSGPLKPLVDLLSCLKFVFKHVRRTSEGHPVLDIDFDVGLQLEQRRPLLE